MANTGGASSSLLIPQPLPSNPAPTQPSHGGGSIRPGSMADRARMANIPMQEQPQKCPRCDSTNTKFCYFNNYSLTQPRHFCKGCRRYWTRGGALRNVPVGGGCRRNKRTKGGSSSGGAAKSPVGSTGPANSGSSADVAGLGPTMPPPMRFMAPLHQLGEIGSSYGLISGSMGGGGGLIGDLNFNMGSALGVASGGGSILPLGGGLEQWRVPQTHQFPFLSGLEASSSSPNSHGGLLYPFEGSGHDQTQGYGGGTSVAKVSASSVKMEENHHHNHELGLFRHLGINNNNNNNPTSYQQQYWGTAGGGATSSWTDLSAFGSSSATTSNPL